MKKIIIITVLMALAMNGFAQQILHYDFSAVCETGQTLYYLITSEEEHTVTLTYPESEENQGFMGDYYFGHPEPQGEIILPSTVYYNDIQYSVTAIDDNAFNNCRNLTGTLTVPEGIVSIGAMAFLACGFTTVIMPKSLEVISTLSYGYGSAFAYCSSLESISVDAENPTLYSENNAIIKREGKVLVVGCKTTTIPDDVETIGLSAFQGAGDGGNLVIPNSVTSIDGYAFYECNFSGAITFSDSLRYIGGSAFEWSKFSGSLTLPNSVTEIGGGAFANCGHLTGDLKLPSSISTINGRSFSGVGCTGTLIIPNSVNRIDQRAFFYTNFSELVLGNSVETIGSAAFNNSHSSTHLSGTLRLPTSLTEIGSEAFAYTSFDEIYSPNRIPPTIQNNDAFNNCDHNIPVHIPFGCTEIYQNTSGWNRFNNFIESEMNLEGEWYYEILNEDGSITYQHLEYAADTTIGTERPKVIVRSNTQYDRDTLFTTVTHEYVYEENGKIYWWNKDLQEFTTLYDLTAVAGDTWTIEVGMESITMQVNSVEYYEYNGLNYRTLHVSDINDLFSGDIVCGIGHLTSFFPERLMSRDKGYRVEGLRCYWVEDKLVFKIGDEDCDAIYTELHGIGEESVENGFAVYPNPTHSVLVVETHDRASQQAETYRITNLMGQTVLSGNITTENQQIDIANLAEGMYFITVGETTQKFVVR